MWKDKFYKIIPFMGLHIHFSGGSSPWFLMSESSTYVWAFAVLCWSCLGESSFLPFIFVGATLFSARRQFIVKQIRGEETTGADKKSGQQLYMPVTGAGNQNAEGRRNRELRALPLLPTEVRLPHFCQDVACQRGILRQKGDYLFFLFFLFFF